MTAAKVKERFGLSIDTPRYYERVGLIPPVARSKGGIRGYGEDDCRWIEFIKRMRGATILGEALIGYVRLSRQGEATREARKKILEEQRDSLVFGIEELKKTPDRLDRKIAHYDTGLFTAETEPARKGERL
jgi:DNA-binding transcriptional MerR regulator